MTRRPAARRNAREGAATREVLEQLAAPADHMILSVGGQTLSVTNLEKPLWPGAGGRGALTKRDLLRYYARIAPNLLEHVRGRPVFVTRFPEGVQGQTFW